MLAESRFYKLYRRSEAVMSSSAAKQEGRTTIIGAFTLKYEVVDGRRWWQTCSLSPVVLSSKLLFLDTLCFNWCWDPSIVNGAGWGCSHRNYKVDYHDNKMCPLGKETMWSMKGRLVPPALIGVVWFGCSSPCSWNRYQMAHEHYNRSNFPNIFNFHRTETDPGVRQQNRALCQLLIPKR